MFVLRWEHVIALIAALGGLSGIIAAIVSAVSNRTLIAAQARKASADAGKSDAEADEARASGAAQLVMASSDFVEKLVVRVSALETSDEAKTETITLLLKNDKENQDKIGQLRAQVAELQAEIARYKRAIESLCKWIRRQGLEPPSLDELGRD